MGYMKNDDSVSEAEKQLQKFLEEHQFDLDEETTCDLLQSHGRIEDWVFFADLTCYDLCSRVLGV